MIDGRKRGKAWFALILLVPALFNFFVFWLYPNFNSILLSFQDSNSEWTLGNYEYVLLNLFSASGEIFAEAFRNTMIYFRVGYFGTQTLNILLAYFFYKKIAGYRFFRFLFLHAEHSGDHHHGERLCKYLRSERSDHFHALRMGLDKRADRSFQRYALRNVRERRFQRMAVRRGRAAVDERRNGAYSQTTAGSRRARRHYAVERTLAHHHTDDQRHAFHPLHHRYRGYFGFRRRHHVPYVRRLRHDDVVFLDIQTGLYGRGNGHQLRAGDFNDARHHSADILCEMAVRQNHCGGGILR